MALDLSTVTGGEKTVKGQEGLKGDMEWGGQLLGKVWNQSTPGMIGSIYNKMQDGSNFFEATGQTVKETHSDRVDVAATVANGAATFYTAGQVDARGTINKAKNALGGDENYTVATDNAQKIGAAASGNPEAAGEAALSAGADILKNEASTSMLGGKKGGGIVSSQDVNEFKAAKNATRELDGPDMDGPVMKMPTPRLSGP